MRVLVARPIDEARPYIEAIEAAGASAHSWAPFHAEPVRGDVPDLSDIDALAFTSRYAIREFAARSDDRALPVFVVGPQSEREAKVHDFTNVHPPCGSVAALADEIITRRIGALYYGRGQEIAHPLQKIMAAAGIGCREEILYRAPAATALPPLTGVNIALFFSPRGARIFSDLVQKQGLEAQLSGTKALCLGKGVLESLADLTWQDISVADSPDRVGMMKSLNRLLVGKDNERDE